MARLKKIWFGVASTLLLLPFFVVYGQTSASPKLTSPLNATSIEGLIKALLDIAVRVGVPIAALFIIYTGFLFIKARGNPEELTKAKNTLLWTIIGTTLLLGAWVIVTAVQGTIRQLQ